MRIAEVAARCGLSIATIRYYERSGLCPPIPRGADGQRRFSERDADWFVLLSSLRDTGMPMDQMRAFAALYQQGDATVAGRKDMLRAHMHRLEARREALDACMGLLKHKLRRYDAILEGRS